MRKTIAMNKLSLLFFASALYFASCKISPIGGILENTHWVLTSLEQDGKPISLANVKKTTLIFSTEELNGGAACNTYFAGYIAQGTGLAVAALGSTKMACPAQAVEASYFAVLSKAKEYSVLKTELIIYAENGELHFAPMTEAEISAAEQANGVGKLTSMFAPIKESDRPHLFPILRVDNPGNYPFIGQMVSPEMYPYFDQQSSEIWNSTGGDVFAVGSYGDIFICRVPGRYVSSDIALFQLKNGELQRSETVAWAWCDEGWCNQQDTWLRDMNKDGRIDLVQHYTLTDDKGKVRDERMSVKVQAADGTFSEDPRIKANPEQFKMADI